MTHEDKQKLAEKIAEKAMSAKNVTYAVVLQAVYEALNARDEEMKQLRNQWISVEKRKPAVPTNEEGIKQTLIAHLEDELWIFDVMYWDCSEEKWRIEGQDWMPEYQYWMPIQKIEKGGEQ